MADQLRLRGGDKTASDNFTGADREVTVDTTEPNLRVHDGKTPGGHRVLMAGPCLIIDKNPCKVTVNGDFEVNGDTELEDTFIKGNLVVDGNFVQNGATIAVNTAEVILTNPGIINPNARTGCKIIPASGNIKSQEDANQYINTCLLALENRLCDWTTGSLDEIIELKDDLEKVWIAILSLENRTDALEALVSTLGGQITEILATIDSIEKEVETNQESIKDHEGRIAALEIAVGEVNTQLGALEIELKGMIGTLNDKVDDLVLEDLVDVNTSAPSEDDYLVYKNGKWTNETQCQVKCNSYIPSLQVLS